MVGNQNKQIGLKIKWPDWEIISLWTEWSIVSWDEIIRYKSYSEQDLIVLLWVANIINAALLYAKQTQDADNNPFVFEKKYNNTNISLEKSDSL